MGSAIAVSLSYHWVFYVTAGLVLLNFFSFCLFVLEKYLGVREISAG